MNTIQHTEVDFRFVIHEAMRRNLREPILNKGHGFGLAIYYMQFVGDVSCNVATYKGKLWQRCLTTLGSSST